MHARKVLESYKEEPKILWKNIYWMERNTLTCLKEDFAKDEEQLKT